MSRPSTVVPGCTVCHDFDLFMSCKEKDGHRHHMERIGLDLSTGLHQLTLSESISRQGYTPITRCYDGFNEQGYGQPGLRRTPPLVPSPQGVMGPPGISVQQQLMQSVRSPPPVRSPQPNLSPRPVPSPRAGPVQSSHHYPPHGTPTHSPAHEAGADTIKMMRSLLGRPLGVPHYPSPAPPSTSGADSSEVTPMTPEDQLSKFVEGL